MHEEDRAALGSCCDVVEDGVAALEGVVHDAGNRRGVGCDVGDGHVSSKALVNWVDYIMVNLDD